MPEIVFDAKALTKVYATGDVEVVALAGVDLKIFAGELVVLQGERLERRTPVGLQGPRGPTAAPLGIPACAARMRVPTGTALPAAYEQAFGEVADGRALVLRQHR